MELQRFICDSIHIHSWSAIKLSPDFFTAISQEKMRSSTKYKKSCNPMTYQVTTVNMVAMPSGLLTPLLLHAILNQTRFVFVFRMSEEP
jgi:hypothetical protein